MKRIYQASVGEGENGNIKQAYSEICYTKQEAVDFCLGIAHKRIREIKNLNILTAKDILDFMDDEIHDFHLSVHEFSAEKRIYDEPHGYGQAFHEFIEKGGTELYDNLLSLVVCNVSHYDLWGNVKNVDTDKNAFVGYSRYVFTEEDCKDGHYRADFMYHDYKGNYTYSMQQKHHFAVTEIWREPIDNDNGYHAWDSGDYDDLDEAVEYALDVLYQDMEYYYLNEEEHEYEDLTEMQKKEVFKEKVSDYRLVIRSISSERIRFESVRELAEYYAEQICSGKITEERMYDFLLSLVQYDERHYDKEGNLLYSKIKLQELDGTTEYDIIPDFSIETAKDIWKQQQCLKEKFYEEI